MFFVRSTNGSYGFIVAIVMQATVAVLDVILLSGTPKGKKRFHLPIIIWNVNRTRGKEKNTRKLSTEAKFKTFSSRRLAGKYAREDGVALRFILVFFVHPYFCITQKREGMVDIFKSVKFALLYKFMSIYKFIYCFFQSSFLDHKVIGKKKKTVLRHLTEVYFFGQDRSFYMA